MLRQTVGVNRAAKTPGLNNLPLIHQLQHIFRSAPVVAEDASVPQIEPQPFLPAARPGILVEPDIHRHAAHRSLQMRLAFCGGQVAFSDIAPQAVSGRHNL